MKIGFITDTNIIKRKDDKLGNERTFLNNLDFFIEYIKDLKKSKSQKELVYIMPDIVIKELYNQKLSIYNKRFNNLVNVFEELRYGLEGEIPKINVELALNDEVEKYKKDINIIELKYSNELFNELVEDALKKKPPFDKTTEGKKEDAGFKDSLIWKTILYSEEIDKFNKLYFFSGDSIFIDNKEELNDSFKIKHPNTELIMNCIKPDGNQIQSCLQIIIDENGLYETDIIKLYNKETILEFINNTEYDYKEKVYYYIDEKKYEVKTINFKLFSKEDFYISEVLKEEDKNKVIINFNTLKYELNDYNETNEKITGQLCLFIKKKNKAFEVQEKNIKNVYFAENSIVHFSKELTNVFETNYNEYIKPLVFTLKNSFYDKVAFDISDFKELALTMNTISNKINEMKIEKLTNVIKPLTIGDYFNRDKKLNEIEYNNKDVIKNTNGENKEETNNKRKKH